VDVKMAGKVAGEKATDIDIKTMQYAIQCKAQNYASVVQAKDISDETVKLKTQIAKTIVYASDTLQHGPNFKAAIVFHEPPPSWVMSAIQEFIDDGKLVILNP
jgi:hypothetical protein